MAEGGQRSVFKAQHNQYGATVIKLFHTSQDTERLARELEVANNASIRHVPRLHAHGSVDSPTGDKPYFIEQYIDGETLRAVLERTPVLPLAQVVSLLRCLLETAVDLEAAHLIHRDIKPENIIVTNNSEAMLIDFGIARHLDKVSLTASLAHFGPHTAGYAAPEQFRNLKPYMDIRVDLFAIGVTCYECLAGAHPFLSVGASRLDVLSRTESASPQPLSIQGDLQGQLSRFVGILMAKSPQHRPSTAAEAIAWYEELITTLDFS